MEGVARLPFADLDAPAWRQRTLKAAIDCAGIGVHSGQHVRLAIRPACVDHGIVFRRTDLGQEIAARFDNVVDTRFSTVLGDGSMRIGIFEDGVPPRFRLYSVGVALPDYATIETTRPNGSRQTFGLVRRDGFLESLDEVPEPHAFAAALHIGAPGERPIASVDFEELDHAGHGAHHQDNNMRAAVVHVLADAAVSVLVIVSLVFARLFHWYWMDPLAGIVGALVIASWSYGLIRDTGGILLDMNPDRRLGQRMRETIEACGDEVDDLHLWRLGPGHLGAIVTVRTSQARNSGYYRNCLAGFRSLSHLTVEVVAAESAA